MPFPKTHLGNIQKTEETLGKCIALEANKLYKEDVIIIITFFLHRFSFLTHIIRTS